MLTLKQRQQAHRLRKLGFSRKQVASFCNISVKQLLGELYYVKEIGE